MKTSLFYQKALCLSTAWSLTLLATPNAHAATRTWNGSTDTNYNETANWSGNDVPDNNDSGILQGGGTGETDLSGGVTPSIASALNVRAGHTFNIDNDGGALTVNNNINVGRGVAGDGSTINHSAGEFNIGGIDMSGNATGGTSSYNLSGTAALSVGFNNANRTFNIGGDLGVGDFDSTFAITGDSATITVNGSGLELRSSAILDFTLGATGVDAIDTTGNLLLQTGAALTIDGSSYTGGIATIPLLVYGSRTDATEFTESITGFGSFSTEVVYSETGIDLVLTITGAPVVTSFTADVTQTSSGDPVMLSWTSENATTLTLDPGATDVTGLTTLTVNPTVTTTYTLTASDGTTSNSQTLEVLVGPRINSLSGSPLSITSTQFSALSWDVDNATSLTLNPGNEDVTGLTTWDVFPTETTTYTLIASNGAAMVQDTIEIIVTPDIIFFDTLEPNIGLGDSTLLEWDVATFTSLTLNPGGIDVTSLTEFSVSPASTTAYTLIATNASASVDSEFTVVVGPTVSSFEASPSLVVSGNDTTLSWTAEDFSTLTLDLGSVDVSAQTSIVITNLTETTTFTLTAADSGGNMTTADVTVGVIPENPPVPSGPTISVNFHAEDADALSDHQVETGETAGFAPVDGSFWNNINVGSPAAHALEPLFPSTPLIDDTGNTTAATIAPSVDSTYFVGHAASAASDAFELGLTGNDDDLFNSYLALNGPNGDGTPADAALVNVTGLGTDYTSGGYTVIIYSDSDRRGGGVGNNTRQSIFTLTPSGGSPLTTFVEDDDPSVINNTFDGVYVFTDGMEDGAGYSNFTLIEGLSADSFTLEITSPDGGRGAISGFQIVGGTGIISTDPLLLCIENAANGTDLDFSWESLAGMSYTLRASTSLNTDPSTWTAVSGQENVLATPPTNTASIPRPADSKAFYIVEEFPTPLE
ncbi:MAG: beta strand repeat-containing protein [Roseibacillus sp.]